MKKLSDGDFRRLIRNLRRKQGFAPLTPAEARAAWDAAPTVPVSQERIKEMVEQVMKRAGEPR